jgi:phospholipid/cholesterol/gamma-HCH transport system permease protein
MLDALSDRLLRTFFFLCDISEMTATSFRDALLALMQQRRPVFSVYLRQVYFSGLEALRIVLCLALVIGTVVIAQTISIAGRESGFLTGKLMTWIVIRELGPLLAAIIVIARSGTAIAAELSQMKISNELEYIQGLGIPIQEYLIMPRIMGMTTALVMLTIYFEVAAVMGGFVIASLGWHVPYELYSQGVFSVLTLTGVAASMAKSALFGVVIAAICCRTGLGVGKSVTQIPQAATRGVMQSLFLLLMLDGLLSLLYLV